MRNFLAGILAALMGSAFLAAIIWIAVLPRLDWGAGQELGGIEQALASSVLSRWIERNADTTTNPVAPTPENLEAAQIEYEEHCAECHGLDGSGRNRFEADFYPPVPKLTGGVQKLSDAELYFILYKGISNTAMPAFGTHHAPADLWRSVLWVRHLGKLTSGEKATIESRMKTETAAHERTMTH